jgi:hypothetical protein
MWDREHATRSHAGAADDQAGQAMLKTNDWLVFAPTGIVMSKNAASWIAIFAGFASSGLALRVAFDLSLPDGLDTFGSDLQLQSVRADIAGIAALVSVIAHVIDKASK